MGVYLGASDYFKQQAELLDRINLMNSQGDNHAPPNAQSSASANANNPRQPPPSAAHVWKDAEE